MEIKREFQGGAGGDDDPEQKAFIGSMDICETTLCKKPFFSPFLWVVHFLLNQ